MKRKIAVLTARADAVEQKSTLLGIINAAFLRDMDVYVFTNIYNHWVRDDVLNFENVIYGLFRPEDFDGVIITAEAFFDISVIDSAAEKIRKTGIPAAVIGGDIEGFISIPSCDREDIRKIAEHLITVHGYRKIDILTGADDDPVSSIRLSGCLDAFNEHGISPNRIIHGNFWNNSGEELAARYISAELELPEAVICLNDYMAYGLSDSLTQAGIDIPGRISITGFDSTDQRILYYPFLTTYRRSRQKLGQDAVFAVLNEEYRAPADGEIIYGNTCPCGVNAGQLGDEIRSQRIGQYYMMVGSVAQLASSLTLCQTLSEFTGVLSKYFYLLHGAKSLRLCLDKAWNSAKYDGREILSCKIDGSKSPELPKTYPLDSLLEITSSGEDSPSVYYLCPLYFQKRLYGCTMLGFARPEVYDFSFRDYSKTVSNALEFLRMKNDIHYLTNCRRISELYDSLTGFYNLREFEHILETVPADGRRLYAVKLIFGDGAEFELGESYRSDIISATAKAIRQSGRNHEVFCRADDSSFLILSKSADTLLYDRIKALVNHSLLSEYDMSAVTAVFTSSEDGLTEARQSAEDLAQALRQDISESCQSLHYKALIALRQEIYAFPKSIKDVKSVSKRLCVSAGYFRSLYRKCFRISYNQDCIEARLTHAKYLLCTGAMSIYAISQSCGYSDVKFFSRQFRQSTGVSPMEYRETVY